jgi:crotonobetainyl-CoA:carnitine CoA-transferase CaiB-like acyl-CoA transferase
MLLQPYRVLDLTHTHGMLCAQILGDLGADVIQIEPPGGAPGRRMAPFRNDEPDPEASLYWWSYARGKRSIELDIDADPDTFLRLVEQADFLIDAERVGSLAARGFDYATLAARNPGLIQVSLTPYGSDGPKAHWTASDITLLASAGPMAITGDEDRPPLRVSVPQAWHHAAAEGATGALVALHERHGSGLGQHVEVSVQQALTAATQAMILSPAVNETTVTRIAGGLKAGDIEIRLTYPAKDGHVSITHLFGATIGPPTRRLMEYVYDEGFCDAATRDKDWLAYGLQLATGEEPIAEWERVKDCVAACTASKTKAVLLEAAMARRLLLAPMTTIEDVVTSDQLAERDYFHKPTGDGPAAQFAYPGPFAKFSATPLPVRARPPSIGEQTQEILADLDALPSHTTAPTERTDTGELPLAGVKVLDFMWALAGPGATRILADWGATVVRVESSSKIDVCRTIRPFMNGDELPENSAIFHSTNAGKRPQHSRGPGRCQGPGALGGRGDRVLLAQGDEGVWSRLPVAQRDQSRHHHAEHVSHGADRTAGHVRRLRQSRCGDRRFLSHHRLGRPGARRTVRRLHRLHLSPLQRGSRAGGARPPPPHRRGATHRPLPGRSVAPFHRTGDTGLHRQRPRAGPPRQPGSQLRAPRRLSRGG